MIILWGFAITCIEKDDAAADFKKGKAWVAQNFTWLYIGAAPHPAAAPGTTFFWFKFLFLFRDMHQTISDTSHMWR